MEQPGWFSDPGHGEIKGCECGCDLEFGQELDDNGRCEACSMAGCGRSCVRPYTMEVDGGDPEELRAWHHLSAVTEARLKILAKWNWYSNDGELEKVSVKLYDGHQTVELTVRAPSEVES